MPHDALLSTLLLPVALAASTAIFSSFGKRRAANRTEPEPLPQNTPVAETVEATDEDEGGTLPVLATFALEADAYADRDACEGVWNALSLPVRTDSADEPTRFFDIPTRFFALTAFDSAPPGRLAAAQTACKLAQDATQRGYSVLLIDADPSFPTLHRLPLFAPREGIADATPTGFADFLRGNATRLEPLLKLAWRTEGLLLLPAGNATDADESLTSSATWDRMLRLASPLAEIVLLVAPPVFAAETVVRNADILLHMNSVLVVYPSAFSAAGDMEAFQKMESMNVPQVGAIVAPPLSFTDGDEKDASPILSPVSEVVTETVDVTEATYATETADVPPVEEVAPAVNMPPPQELSITQEMPITPMTDDISSALEPPAMSQPLQDSDDVPSYPAPTQEVTAPPRPSFMAARTATPSERARGNARRAVPINSVPTYTAPPSSREAAAGSGARGYQAAEPEPTPPAPPTNALPTATTSYRPDVSLELLPATGEPSVLTLRADVGGTGNGPALTLEVRTRVSESKRLRAHNPGSQSSADSSTPLLVLESLTPETAPEEATTLRLVVRESGAAGAAILLEAMLETPDALRIKSGKAAAAGVPPVRFEVTTEPDETARFRATVPPLGDAPALFVDLERVTTAEGRWSRVVLRQV